MCKQTADQILVYTYMYIPILTLSATLPSTASPLNIFIEVDGIAAVATKAFGLPSPLKNSKMRIRFYFIFQIVNYNCKLVRCKCVLISTTAVSR